MIDLEAAKKIYEATTQDKWEIILWPNGEFEVRSKNGPQDTAYGNICSTEKPVKEGRKDECFANGTFIGYAHEIFPAALSEIEALRKVAEAAKFEAATHDAITGPCDCVLCKALSDAGYGGGE